MKFEIVLGRKCNFRCGYCYIPRSGETYFSDAMNEATVDQTCKYITFCSTPSEKIHLSFFGGEPLLYAEQIDRFVSNLHENPNIRFHLVSNGYLIDSRIEFIKKWKNLVGDQLSFLFSFDYAFQNNRKEGTYDHVVSNMRLLDSLDITFETNTVLLQKDIENFHLLFNDYLDVQRKLSRKFPLRIQMDTASCVNSVINTKSLEAVKAFLEKYPKYAKSVVYKFGKDRYFNCGLGWRVTAGIDYDGSLYPCQGAIYDVHRDWFKFGSVYDDFDLNLRRYKELINKLRWPIQTECKACNAWCKSCPLETIKTNLNEFGLMPTKEQCYSHKTLTQFLKYDSNRTIR